MIYDVKCRRNVGAEVAVGRVRSGGVYVEKCTAVRGVSGRLERVMDFTSLGKQAGISHSNPDPIPDITTL